MPAPPHHSPSILPSPPLTGLCSFPLYFPLLFSSLLSSCLFQTHQNLPQRSSAVTILPCTGAGSVSRVSIEYLSSVFKFFKLFRSAKAAFSTSSFASTLFTFYNFLTVTVFISIFICFAYTAIRLVNSLASP